MQKQVQNKTKKKPLRVAPLLKILETNTQANKTDTQKYTHTHI